MSKPCCNLIEGLKLNLDSVLGVRDTIGATLHKVYLITRTWSGKQPGEGQAIDQSVQIKPTPGIKEYAHDLRLVEGGAVKQGDIILRGISKHIYPNETFLDGRTGNKSVEKFYLINDRLYTVINIKENYVTWDVQLRKLSNQTRYGGG